MRGWSSQARCGRVAQAAQRVASACSGAYEGPMLSSILALVVAAPEPVFSIELVQSVSGGEATYTARVTARYAPCPSWTGGTLGVAVKDGVPRTPEAFLEHYRGLAGVPANSKIPFYAVEQSGEAFDNDGAHAAMTPLGNGGTHTIVIDRGSGPQIINQLPPQPGSHADVIFTRKAKGASLRFEAPLIQTGGANYIYSMSLATVDLPPEQLLSFHTFELSEEELQDFSKFRGQHQLSYEKDGEKLTALASLTADLQGLDEVTLEAEGYERWLPEGSFDGPKTAGTTLTVRAFAHRRGQPKSKPEKKVKLQFLLDQVSREPGVCMNWPKSDPSSDPDLQFERSRNKSVRVVSLDEAKTEGPVEEASVTVSAFDFAARGILRVSAKDTDDRELKVRFMGKEGGEVEVPKVDQDGIIAHAWRAREGMEGAPITWDESKIPGQNAVGDGLSLFEKYRGVRVLEGSGYVHHRLVPTAKTTFIVDPSRIVDLGWLEKASKFKAFRLDDTLLQPGSRAVAFNGGTRHKFAVRVDLDNTTTTNPTTYGETVVYGSPGKANKVVVYQGKIRALIERLRKNLIAADDPKTKDDRLESDVAFKQCKLKPEEVKAALARLQSPAELESLVRRLVRLSAIHELGHVHGLAGHTRMVVDKTQANTVSEEEGDEAVGEASCPMQYLGTCGRRAFVVFGVLPAEGPYCGEGYNCFSELTTQD